MLRRISKKLLLAGFVSSIIALSLAPLAAAAGTATLSLSPPSGALVQGSTLSVGIYEDSGTDNINVVQTNINFPANLLTYKSYSDSPNFSVAAQCTPGGCPSTNGQLKIARGANPSVNGKQLVITLYFTVTAGSGTADITFDAATSKVVIDGGPGSTTAQTESLTYQNGSYTLSTPPVTPPPATTPPASGSSSPPSTPKAPASSPKSSSSSPSTTPAPGVLSMLSISNITTDNISSDTASIKWTTSAAASSEVNYGPDTNYGLTAADDQLITDHNLPLSSKDLRASLVYHFMIKSVDSKGEVATSPDMTFNTAADGSLAFSNSTNSKINSNLGLAVGAVVLIAVASIAGAVAIRHMHHHAQVHAFETSTPTVSNAPKPIILNPRNPTAVIKPNPSNAGEVIKSDSSSAGQVIKPDPSKDTGSNLKQPPPSGPNSA